VIAVTPAEVIDAPDADTSRRLAAYWQARDRFIALGRDVRPSADVVVMLSQLREPLLSLLRTSPDFRPAYDPLLQMAQALALRDRIGAQQLLRDLIEVQPAREEARKALQTLQP
jgi:spermidine synthase